MKKIAGMLVVLSLVFGLVTSAAARKPDDIGGGWVKSDSGLYLPKGYAAPPPPPPPPPPASNWGKSIVETVIKTVVGAATAGAGKAGLSGLSKVRPIDVAVRAVKTGLPLGLKVR